jgi:hypothetical protein
VNIPFGSLLPNAPINFDWPCSNGISISSVGTGGVYAVQYS